MVDTSRKTSSPALLRALEGQLRIFKIGDLVRVEPHDALYEISGYGEGGFGYYTTYRRYPQLRVIHPARMRRCVPSFGGPVECVQGW